MVDFDLRKLSAPVEALRSDVNAAYKRLDSKWAEVAALLKKLPIPCKVGYTFSENPNNPGDYDCLEWAKSGGKKRICIVAYRFEPSHYCDDDTSVYVTPYEEWSGEQRVEMLNHVPGLFKAAAEQTKEFIAETQD